MSPEIKRRLKIFQQSKPAMLALFFLIALGFLSTFSEWVTNSKPVFGVINGKFVVPAYVDYNKADLGSEGAGLPDYRELKPNFKWALWPVFNWDPIENDIELEPFMFPPTKSHIMGSDVAGRDVFARLLYGARISFVFALGCWFFTYLIGTSLGLAQGFYGGKIDLVGQRIVEIFSSIPVLYLLLLLISLISPNLFFLVVIASVFGWVSISQYMRGEALKNRSLVYTEAARALGATQSRLIFRHILPNSLIPLVTFSPFAIVGFISYLSSLDFLGFGVPAPTPSWGELFDQARSNFQTAWWLATFPTLFVFFTVVALNFIGEALRSAFDPRA